MLGQISVGATPACWLQYEAAGMGSSNPKARRIQKASGIKTWPDQARE
jgi:hypothetical protein